MIKSITAIFLIFVVVILGGCSRNIPTAKQRGDIANKIAISNNFMHKTYKTDLFNIFSYRSPNIEEKIVNIYIESDGLSWISKSQISSNPTPINPISLKLMAKDKSKSKIYLARPCQYIKDNRLLIDLIIK
jgi:hypothetical protein